jgi:putative MFS transporter
LILIGTVLVSVCSLLALPLLRASPDNAWRYILGFPVVAIIVVFLIGKRHIVESPRWLVEHGRWEEAIAIVRTMDRRARRGDSDLHEVAIVEAPRPHSTISVKPMAILFATRRLYIRLGIISLAVLTFYISYFSLSTYLTAFLVSTGFDEDRALEIVAVSRVAPVVAAIVIVFIIERVERRLIIAGSIVAIIAGVALIMLGLGEVATLTGTILASLAGGILVPALYTFIAEIFPTDVRATGTAFADGVGRLGGVIAPFVFVPILFGAGAVASGTFLIVLMAISLVLIFFGLPFKTKGRALDDASA